MIDTDRLDVSQPIDLSIICNTGLYTIEPHHKHFGIQLTDEVRQQILGCYSNECLLGYDTTM
jgi:hypothetical protein